MQTMLLLIVAADGPPRASYPDDPPWGDVRAAAPSYRQLHGWLHERRSAGDPRSAVVAVGPEACREAPVLARATGLAWQAYPALAEARAAGFPEPGLHWLAWDGTILRHWRPAQLVAVPRDPPPASPCPGGICRPRGAGPPHLPWWHAQGASP